MIVNSPRTFSAFFNSTLASPASFAVTLPFSSTSTTDGLEDSHNGSDIILPSGTFVYASCFISPFFNTIDDESGTIESASFCSGSIYSIITFTVNVFSAASSNTASSEKSTS